MKLRLRYLLQFGFLALTIYGVFVLNAHCERWCPFGGVESIYSYVNEGAALCSIGTSNFFILGGVLLSVVLARRVFCSHACPIGTISEWTGRLGRSTGLPQWKPGGRTDAVLRLLKYPVLAVILYFTYRAGELIFRGFDPCYALIGRHGEDITYWAYVVAGAILVCSLLISLPFCRWLCPLAAVMSPLSRLGLLRVRRDGDTCKDCGLCAKKCPMSIPIDQVKQASEARCTLCLECQGACPVGENRPLSVGAAIGPAARRGGASLLVAIIILGCLAAAVILAEQNPLPSLVKTREGVDSPAEYESIELKVENLKCRGSANRLWYFLDRQDLFHLPGYLKFEAWPGPGMAAIRVTFDPSQTDVEAVKQAIVEPIFVIPEDGPADHMDSDPMAGDDLGHIEQSPFKIEGYEPVPDDDLPPIPEDLDLPGGMDLPGMDDPMLNGTDMPGI